MAVVGPEVRGGLTLMHEEVLREGEKAVVSSNVLSNYH